jgi:hypothetical protein
MLSLLTPRAVSVNVDIRGKLVLSYLFWGLLRPFGSCVGVAHGETVIHRIELGATIGFVVGSRYMNLGRDRYEGGRQG